MFPALQAAREAARRMTCANNLKQLGLAVHNYQDARQVFPAATNYPPVDSGASGASAVINWAVVSLPYLEDTARYEDFFGSFTSGAVLAGDYFKGKPGTIAQEKVEVLICPSAPSWQVGINPAKDAWEPTPFGGMHYEATAARVTGDDDKSVKRTAGMGGSGFYWCGIMTRLGTSPAGTGGPTGKSVIKSTGNTIASITDGLSHTFLIGETPPLHAEKQNVLNGEAEPLSNNAFGWFQYDTAWAGYSGGMLSRFRVNELPKCGHIKRGNRAVLSNTASPNCPYCHGYYMDIRSFHPGTAGVAMGDGAVRALSGSMDLKTKHNFFDKASGKRPSFEYE
jgi:hypothetical protein